jgi:DNA-binding response OmpR family regulator
MNNILVVEDQASLQLLYKQELTDEGYYVYSCSTEEDALFILDKEKIDIVVLDLKLPKMNGLDILELMMLRNRNLKVIINSAYSHYKDDFSSWLADDYLIKSSDLNPLKFSIHNCLNPNPA